MWRLAGLCVVGGVLLAGMLFPVVGGLGMVSNQSSNTVTSVSEDLVSGKVPLVTTVTNRAGEPIAYLYKQYRVKVPSSKIADTMKAAIIAIEDRRFFEHEGVDWRGVTRALVHNIITNGAPLQGQGASTLTMQYVQNYLLYAVADTEAEKQSFTASTITAKLREVRIALQVEQQLSKQEILTRYLNLVYYGNGAYGIKAAARTYFDTTPAELTIPQAALLAGIVRSPSEFDPVDNPRAALQRRNVVIAQMAEVGSITQTQAQQAMAAPLGIEQPLTGLPNGCIGADQGNGFFCAYVVNYLKRHGWTEKQLKTGGYTIRTTLSPEASKAANQAVLQMVPRTSGGITNVMTVVKPGQKRHEVLALASSRRYGLDEEKGETMRAQPSQRVPFGAGSIYKIFTAAAALAEGLGIKTMVPVFDSYTSTEFTNGSRPYTVGNVGNYANAPVTLQKALAISPNTTFVYLEDQIGSVDPIVNMAYELGLRRGLSVPVEVQGETKPLRKVIKEQERASFTLGPTPTIPLELANVAATLMSGGTWCPPTPIISIKDRKGNPVKLKEQPCQQVVPENLADAMVLGLSKDTIYGTATGAANAAGWTRPMMGKTGTTQNYKSVGFVGATPQFAGATMLWSDGSNPLPICNGNPPYQCGYGAIFGANIAPTWFRTMVPLHQGLPVKKLPSTTPRYLTGGSGATVPDVIGLKKEDAIDILQDAGYEVDSDLVDSARSYGIVVGQSPNGGATVLPGQTVQLNVSDGTPPPSPAPEPEPPEQTSSTPTPTLEPPLSEPLDEPTFTIEPIEPPETAETNEPEFSFSPPSSTSAEPPGSGGGTGGDGPPAEERFRGCFPFCEDSQ